MSRRYENGMGAEDMTMEQDQKIQADTKPKIKPTLVLRSSAQQGSCEEYHYNSFVSFHCRKQQIIFAMFLNMFKHKLLGITRLRRAWHSPI